MSEIQEKEYVRSKAGDILKVLEYDKEIDMCLCTDNKYKAYLDKKDIVKHSKNIIDLIEDTDILKVEISEEWVIKEDTVRLIIVGQTNTLEEIKEALENGIYNIKSIVTHEQFSSMEYRVKEN